ncbi:MAG: HAMP domain-containing protein [Chloroflexota bacterium]|nr:HAMP domain-containing protein [Chloroflexota bacterium]
MPDETAPTPTTTTTRRFLAAASWRRALAETVALAVIVTVLLPLYPGRHSTLNQLLAYMLLIGPAGCALWLALRLRLPAGLWWRAMLIEAPVGLLLAIAPAGTLLFVLLRDYMPTNPRRQPEYLVVVGVIIFLFVLAFTVYRAGVRLWLWWDIKRRRSLRWALTHALLAVATTGVGIVALSLLALQIIFFRPNAPLFQWLTAIVFVSILLIIGILVALPPSAIFSFLFARGASRRILDLAHATERLRSGDLSARAPVQGEDEVALLQANFNAMAADLERGVDDLLAERDRVARLLDQRRELIASVSHELRTPVATLRGYLESASLRWNEDATPDTLRHDVDVMLHETQRLQTLIDDLFTLARAQVGRLDLHCEATDVGALARRAVETMAPLAWRGARVEVVARVAPELPAAWIDPARTEQALHNLLRNAMRHTPPGGIIAVVAERAGERLALRVRDTGEGISAEDLPRIWERFYRSDHARASDASGSGLGLALVKEVVEAMDGAVEVESAPGAGSVFTLLLLAADAEVVAPTTPSVTAAL